MSVVSCEISFLEIRRNIHNAANSVKNIPSLNLHVLLQKFLKTFKQRKS